MSIRTILTIVMLVSCLSAVGCQTPTTSSDDYATVNAEPRRDTDVARRHDARGLKLLAEGDLEQAEKAFKAALEADVMFGPAHNNLGAVYLRQAKLYLAAWEFQYAAKLMPNHPEPRNNLGLVFEAAGKLNDAVDWYAQAVELAPDNAELIGNLARARVRRGDSDDETRELLSQLVMKDTRSEWVDWAKQRLALMRSSEDD